ncbi:MAG: gluconate 2-dehydrogenase subunit 3 family protein [Acidobacteria bacterium]|jgi:hypothetical protein|nr:gluconate 2-dehydrogenase subunit 3 family protein [Acidobacteriota bacterium]
MTEPVSRRDLLRTLAVGGAASSVLKVIPAQAAQHAHHMIAEEKAAAPSAPYKPKFFSPRQYQVLKTLCNTIIPPDSESGGAVEAGAPEFIDLLTSENEDFQLTLGGGILWLDATCTRRYGKTYLESSPGQQKEILDLIAYRKTAETDPSLSQGVAFFALLRNMAADGFFTSKMGIKYLGYIGNAYLTHWDGCPPLPE